MLELREHKSQLESKEGFPQEESLDLTLKAAGSLCEVLWEGASVSKLTLAGTESITLEESG